jgi:hypothetical protein
VRRTYSSIKTSRMEARLTEYVKNFNEYIEFMIQFFDAEDKASFMLNLVNMKKDFLTSDIENIILPSWARANLSPDVIIRELHNLNFDKFAELQVKRISMTRDQLVVIGSTILKTANYQQHVMLNPLIEEMQSIIQKCNSYLNNVTPQFMEIKSSINSNGDYNSILKLIDAYEREEIIVNKEIITIQLKISSALTPPGQVNLFKEELEKIVESINRKEE